MKKLIYNLFAGLGVFWLIVILAIGGWLAIVEFDFIKDKAADLLAPEPKAEANEHDSISGMKILPDGSPSLNELVRNADASGQFYQANFTAEPYIPTPYSLEEWNELAAKNQCPDHIIGFNKLGYEACQPLANGQTFEQTNVQFTAINNYVLAKQRDHAYMVFRRETNDKNRPYEVYHLSFKDEYSNNQIRQVFQSNNYPSPTRSAEENQRKIMHLKEAFEHLDLSPDLIDLYYPGYEN